MKVILSSMLALAIAGLSLRVQEPDDKGKPQQEEPKKKPPEAKPKQQPEEKPRPKPEKPPKQEPAAPPKQQADEKQRDKQQKEQAKRGQTETTRPGDRRQQSAGKGQRIPPEKFRASFGREHHFRVARSGGDDRRFRYGGYWFEVVEVWPAGWSFDDDCYIEEVGDDYFLVDIVHPEVRVLVIVVSA